MVEWEIYSGEAVLGEDIAFGSSTTNHVFISIRPKSLTQFIPYPVNMARWHLQLQRNLTDMIPLCQ